MSGLVVHPVAFRARLHSKILAWLSSEDSRNLCPHIWLKAYQVSAAATAAARGHFSRGSNSS